MWYNVIPPFVPLDPNLYPTYLSGTIRFDPSIFNNYICYVLGLCIQYPSNLLYHLHIHHILLEMVQPITSGDREVV